jgi:hypothetical protein
MTTQKLIVPLGKSTGYIEAAALAKGMGGKLPSNVLHDEHLVTRRNVSLSELIGYYPAWAREILVYPQKNGKFQAGKDVIDSETGWLLPASYIPEEAVGKEGIGLFVDPGVVKDENGKVIIHPAGITLLAPFIQENGDPGRVDEATRIPLAHHAFKYSSSRAIRTLWRIDGVGIRPLIRGYALPLNLMQNVSAHQLPDQTFGVALEVEAPVELHDVLEKRIRNITGRDKDIFNGFAATVLQEIKSFIK